MAGQDSNESVGADDNSKAISTPKKRGLWWKILLCLTLMFVVFIAALPTLVSILGTGAVQGTANSAAGVNSQIKSLSISWLGSQSIEGIKLLDANGATAVSVEKIQTDATLLSLATGSLNLGATTITGLNININIDEDGNSNLDSLINTESTSTSSTNTYSVSNSSSPGPAVLPTDLAVTLKVVNATISLKQAGLDEVKVQNFNYTTTLKGDGSPITAIFSAAVSQAGLQGDIKGNAEIKNLIDSNGAINEANAQIDISAQSTDLPVAGIDRILQQNGLITALLGNRLTLKVGAQGSIDAPTLSAQIDADRLKLSRFSGAIQNDRFVMDQPTTLTATLTPALTTALDQNNAGVGLALTQDTTLQLKIESLSVPTDGNPASLAAKISLAGQNDVVLQGDAALGRVALSNLAVNIDTQNLSKNIDLNLNANLNVDGRDGAIQADAQIAKLYTTAGQLDLTNFQPNINTTITNLPLGLVDRLANLNGLAVEALGDRIDQLAIKSSPSSAGTQLTASLKSPGLNIKDLSFALNDSLTLTQPVTIPYTLTPTLLTKLAGPDSGLILEKPVQANLTLSRLNAKLPDSSSSNKAFDPTQTALTATLALSPVAIQLPQTDAPALPIKLANTQLNITADSLAHTTIDLQTSANINDSAALQTLGPINLNLQTSAAIKPNSKLGPTTATLNLNAQGLASNIKLAIADELASATIQPNSTVNLTLDTPRLRAFGLLQETGPSIAKPVALALTINETKIPLTNFNLNQITTSAAAQLGTLTFAGDPKLANTSLVNTNFTLDFQGPTGAAKINLASAIQPPGEKAANPVTLAAKLTNLLDKQGAPQPAAANIDADLNFADLPSAFVDALAGSGATITDLAGPALNLDAKINIAPNADGQLNVQLQSTRLQADAALKLGKSIQQTQPAKITLNLTPQSYANLTRPAPPADSKSPAPTPNPITLLQDVLVEITLNKITGPDFADPNLLGFDATLTASPIRMMNAKTGNEAVFNNAIANITSTKLADAITAKINGDIGLAKSSLGKLITTAIITNPIPKDETTKPSLNLDTKLNNVSVHAADTLLNQDGLLVALLGDTMNLTLTANLNQMNGPAHLTLQSTHAKVDLPLNLNNGFATLTQNATAQLTIQESLGQRFISHPLLKQAVRSENPITVLIYKEGLRVPIENFDIADLNIQKLTVDPGKLVIRNAGLVRTLIQLPESIGKVTRGNLEGFQKAEGADEMNAWFTPVDISIIKGQANYSRMDMLIGANYQIATWGHVDLINEQGNMVLGIAERAMRRIYGVNLYADDPTYVDQFPMIGPLATLGPDMADLNARIVLLTGGGTAAKIGGEAGEKLFGAILGGLTKIDQATNKKRKFVKPAPAPRLPFPWPDETAATPQAAQTQPVTQPTTQPATEQPKELSKDEKLGRDINTGIKLLEGLFKKK